MEAPLFLDEKQQANGILWTRIVELDFVQHPRVERPEIIKMDKG